MNDRHYRSKQGELSVSIAAEAVEAITQATLQHERVECGGILIGHYSSDGAHASICAVWTPADSKGTPLGFERGCAGLNQFLQDQWNAPERCYYLGEWHSHLADQPTPSEADKRQMWKFARSGRVRCSRPLLLIAYLPSPKQCSFSLSVFGRPSRFYRLVPSAED